jgi:hypothetical protein
MRTLPAALFVSAIAVIANFCTPAFAQTRASVFVAPVTVAASAAQSAPSGFNDVVRHEVQLSIERTRLFNVVSSTSTEIDALLTEMVRSGRRPPRSINADYIYAVEIQTVSMTETLQAAPHMATHDLVAVRGDITLNISVLSPNAGVLARFSVDASYRPAPQLQDAASTQGTRALDRPTQTRPLTDPASFQELARAAAARIAGRILENNNAVQIVEVQGSRVWISRGAESGYAIGDMLSVRNAGHELHDPVTGELLGDTGSIIGRIRLIEVQPRLAIGEVLESTVPFQVGFAVKGGPSSD